MNGTTRRPDERAGVQAYPAREPRHWRLRARRTEAELEVLLAERLAILRARTDQPQLDLHAGDDLGALSGLPT